MKFRDWLKEEYGDRKVNWYVGMTFIVSWCLFMIAPEHSYLVLLCGFIYFTIQYTPIFKYFESDENKDFKGIGYGPSKKEELKPIDIKYIDRTTK